MSVDLFVFIRQSDLPDTARWQGALDRFGIDVRLDDAVDASDHSGYWPVHTSGSQSGFEYYSGTIADAFGGEPPSELDGRDYVVNFVTHSDLGELRCAMFAASALALEADGLVLDDDTGGLASGDALLDQARSITLPE